MGLCRGFLPVKQYIICVVLWLVVVTGLCPFAWCADLISLSLRGKLANQSSTRIDYQGFADNAIDGNASPTFIHRSCTHTEIDEHPWWKVDLETTHCLGKVVLVNRDIASDRLTGAVVRVGLNADFSQNVICGSPVTSAQASIPGAHLAFMCDPPVAARFVSVDIDVTRKMVLTLCEVMVEEYTADRRTSCGFELTHEGPCAKSPRPLASSLTTSLMPCTVQCKRNVECWFFDYAPTTGRCRLFAEREVDLVLDNDVYCVEYAVVDCGVAKNDVCNYPI